MGKETRYNCPFISECRLGVAYLGENMSSFVIEKENGKYFCGAIRKDKQDTQKGEPSKEEGLLGCLVTRFFNIVDKKSGTPGTV